jgi:hypothetical protein
MSRAESLIKIGVAALIYAPLTLLLYYTAKDYKPPRKGRIIPGLFGIVRVVYEEQPRDLNNNGLDEKFVEINGKKYFSVIDGETLEEKLYKK